MPISTAQPAWTASSRCKDGKMVLAARAVSAGLLRQGPRRPHRRSERRLEGPRAVGSQRRPHAVADRRRQGHEAAWRCTSSSARIRWRTKRRPKSSRHQGPRRSARGPSFFAAAATSTAFARNPDCACQRSVHGYRHFQRWALFQVGHRSRRGSPDNNRKTREER